MAKAKVTKTSTGKAALIDKIAQNTDFPKTTIGAILTSTLEAITDSLKNPGDRVALPGLGVLKVTTRAARKGVNPQTKEPISIPEQKTVRFKASTTIKEDLN